MGRFDKDEGQEPKEKVKSRVIKYLDEKKKARKASGKNGNPLKRWGRFARSFTRIYHPELPFYQALDIGLRWKAGELPGEFDNFDDDQQRYLYLYHYMERYIFGFEKDIKRLNKDPKYYDDLLQHLQTAASAARSEDISTLREKGLHLAVRFYGPLTPEIPNGDDKSGRGFAHPMLTRLLCPIDHLEELEQDFEGTREKLLTGQLSVTGKQLPAFLWPPGEYDPGDPSEGLLRNPLLVEIAKHIFTSPSSTNLVPKLLKVKKGQADKCHMSTEFDGMTPGSVAYVAMQLRWCLSQAKDWRRQDGAFDCIEFFDELMRLLNDEDEDDREWWNELKAWWNTQVFGRSNPSSTQEAASEPTSSNVTTIIEQRRAKQAAARKTAQPNPHTTPQKSHQSSPIRAQAAQLKNSDPRRVQSSPPTVKSMGATVTGDPELEPYSTPALEGDTIVEGDDLEVDELEDSEEEDDLYFDDKVLPHSSGPKGPPTTSSRGKLSPSPPPVQVPPKPKPRPQPIELLQDSKTSSTPPSPAPQPHNKKRSASAPDSPASSFPSPVHKPRKKSRIVPDSPGSPLPAPPLKLKLTRPPAFIPASISNVNSKRRKSTPSPPDAEMGEPVVDIGGSPLSELSTRGFTAEPAPTLNPPKGKRGRKKAVGKDGVAPVKTTIKLAPSKPKQAAKDLARHAAAALGSRPRDNGKEKQPATTLEPVPRIRTRITRATSQAAAQKD